MSPTPKPGILDIAPYVGGRAHAPGAARVFKLSSNESALGPSPTAIEAFKAASGVLDIYPEGSAKILRDAIGEAYGLNPGPHRLRQRLGRIADACWRNAYLRPGDEVLFSEHAFLVYRIATLANSAVPVVGAGDRICASMSMRCWRR